MNHSSENNYYTSGKHGSNPQASGINFDETVSALHQIEKDLSQLSSNSEREFLEIGGKLQNYLASSRQIGNSAATTATSISDEILDKGINELSNLIEQFSSLLAQSFNEISNDKNELLTIRGRVSLIVDELGGYRKIVKKLRMLGVATKIESTRLGTDDNGFNALADNVDGLSALINEKVESINRKAVMLVGEIGKTTDTLSKLSIKHGQQSDLIINNTKHSLKTFESKYNESLKKVEDISRNSQEVSKNIRDIVTSIQFHDITRQQIEHVCEALNEAERSVQTGNEELENRSAEIVHDVCELQVVQLENSLREFENAVENIINRLRNVELNITGIFDQISDLFGSKKSADYISLKTVQNELITVSSELMKNRDLGSELSNSIIAVVDILDELAEHVEQIENIGTEIEIIALNARVKAARSGSQGAGLGVLAEAIQNLSHDAKTHTNSTAEVLAKISEASKKLKSNADDSENISNDDTLASVNERINKLMETLVSIESETKVTIDTLTLEVNSLRSEIETTVRDISIHTLIGKVINKSILDLTKITDTTRHKATQNLNREKHTKNMKQKYTMHIERKIHNNYTDGNGAGFEKPSSQTNNSGEDHLGDNVELF